MKKVLPLLFLIACSRENPIKQNNMFMQMVMETKAKQKLCFELHDPKEIEGYFCLMSVRGREEMKKFVGNKFESKNFYGEVGVLGK